MKEIQTGFTLIELMIVVTIIGILASIVLPAYQTYTIRTQVTEGFTLSDELKSSIGGFVSSRGYWPASAQSAGASWGTSITGNYVTEVNVGAAGVAHSLLVTYGNRANQTVQNKVVELRATLNEASGIVWLCGDADGSGLTLFNIPPAKGSAVTPYVPVASPFTTVEIRYMPTNCRR